MASRREILDEVAENQGLKRMETSLPEECSYCGVPISPQQAEDSYHATYSFGRQNAMVLCGQHLDEEQRKRREAWD